MLLTLLECTKTVDVTILLVFSKFTAASAEKTKVPRRRITKRWRSGILSVLLLLTPFASGFASGPEFRISSGLVTSFTVFNSRKVLECKNSKFTIARASAGEGDQQPAKGSRFRFFKGMLRSIVTLEFLRSIATVDLGGGNARESSSGDAQDTTPFPEDAESNPLTVIGGAKLFDPDEARKLRDAFSVQPDGQSLLDLLKTLNLTDRLKQLVKELYGLTPGDEEVTLEIVAGNDCGIDETPEFERRPEGLLSFAFPIDEGGRVIFEQGDFEFKPRALGACLLFSGMLWE